MVCRFFLVFFCLCVAAPASATTINFSRLATQDWTDRSVLPGLTIEGGSEVDGQVQTGTASVGHRRYGALGIRGADDTGRPDGTHQIDTVGANDVVVFRFDQAVRLERISFTMTDYWDRFDIYLGEDLSFHRTMKVDDLIGFDWVSTVLLGAGYEGTTFAIGASEYQACGYDVEFGHDCWTEHSAFMISSVTFSAIDTGENIDVAPIPVPSSMLLITSALAGLILTSSAKTRRLSLIRRQ